MRVEDLKNYGKGLMDSIPDSEGLRRIAQTSNVMDEELQRELGLEGFRQLKSRIDEAVARMKAHDWSAIRERGLTSQRFLDGVIHRIAVMKALADMVGMERATAIQCRLLDETIFEMMSPIWPSVEDYEACGDFFEAFKEYGKVSMEANVRAGLHEIDIVEDSSTLLAFNVTSCVWHEVARAFGDPYLCYPSTCYGDEVTIPRVLGQVGYRFKRSGTMAQGAPACDFRYEPADGDS
jgi:hypothetical protein